MIKRTKYRNCKVKINQSTYDSKKEARRGEELKLLERASVIQNLRFQVPFELIPPQRDSENKAIRACKYIADFVYQDGDKTIIEDSKGMKTKEYLIKKKLMLFVHGIEILES